MTLLAEGVDSIEITVDTKICANPGCKEFFTPTRHNQKYCQKECRKIVTNATLMEQYYEERDRRAGVKRICKTCNITPLSRYNEGTVCQVCILKSRSEDRMQLLQMMGIS